MSPETVGTVGMELGLWLLTREGVVLELQDVLLPGADTVVGVEEDFSVRTSRQQLFIWLGVRGVMELRRLDEVPVPVPVFFFLVGDPVETEVERGLFSSACNFLLSSNHRALSCSWRFRFSLGIVRELLTRLVPIVVLLLPLTPSHFIKTNSFSIPKLEDSCTTLETEDGLEDAYWVGGGTREPRVNSSPAPEIYKSRHKRKKICFTPV